MNGDEANTAAAKDEARALAAALSKLRLAVETGLGSVADAVEQKRPTKMEPLAADSPSSEYMRLTILRFNELQSLSATADGSPV